METEPERFAEPARATIGSRRGAQLICRLPAQSPGPDENARLRYAATEAAHGEPDMHGRRGVQKGQAHEPHLGQVRPDAIARQQIRALYPAIHAVFAEELGQHLGARPVELVAAADAQDRRAALPFRRDLVPGQNREVLRALICAIERLIEIGIAVRPLCLGLLPVLAPRIGIGHHVTVIR